MEWTISFYVFFGIVYFRLITCPYFKDKNAGYIPIFILLFFINIVFYPVYIICDIRLLLKERHRLYQAIERIENRMVKI